MFTTRPPLRSSAHRASGFTLVEIVVSLGLMAILLFSLAATTASSVSLNEFMQERRVATAMAQGVLNRILSMPEINNDPVFWDGANEIVVADADFALFAVGGVAPTEIRDKSLANPDDNWQGSIAIDSYQYQYSSTGTPPVVLVGPYETLTPDPATAGWTGLWNDGNVYKVTVTLTWRPTSWRRSGKTGMLSGKARVVLSSLYYPSPVANGS